MPVDRPERRPAGRPEDREAIEEKRSGEEKRRGKEKGPKSQATVQLDYSSLPTISALKAPAPPVGVARVAPQTRHLTTVAGRWKAICSLPQSPHLTFTKVARVIHPPR